MLRAESIKEKFDKKYPVSRILSSLAIDGRTLKNVSIIHGLVLENIDKILDKIYGFILGEDGIKSRFFDKPEDVERLKRINRHSIVQMFVLPIDKAYLHRRLAVGIIHFEIELPLLYYMKSISILRDAIHDLLLNTPNIEEVHEKIISLGKLLNLDSYIIMEAYHLSYEVELQMKVDRTKNLIRVVTHDINNPLQVIIGNLSILKRRIVDKSLESFLENIIKSSRQMTLIIKNVVELSLLKGNESPLRYERISVEQIWKELKYLFAERCKKKGILITLNNQVSEGTYLNLPKVELCYSVLGNIISNAIKFTGEGGIITFSAKEEGHFIVFHTADTGIGIPKDLLARLQKMGANTHRIGTDGEPGTGQGMMVTRYYVEKMGGNMTVKSLCIQDHPKNHGTEIILRLPKNRKRLEKPSHMFHKNTFHTLQ